MLIGEIQNCTGTQIIASHEVSEWSDDGSSV